MWFYHKSILEEKASWYIALSLTISNESDNYATFLSEKKLGFGFLIYIMQDTI